MNLQQFNPWNWFKHEGYFGQSGSEANLPIKRSHDSSLIKAESPLSPWWEFHREMDRLFDGFFSGSNFSNSPMGFDSGNFTPSLDLSAEKNHYDISVEMPGLDESDISIELSNNLLTIHGEKKEEKNISDKQYYRVERRFGAFQRVLSLPADVDKDNIQAKMKNGVLHLMLPRQVEMQENVKKIEINKLN